MRITDIRIFVAGNPWKNWLFVRVETDAGIHGIGEGSLGHLNHAVEGAVRDITPKILGMDPFDVEAISLKVNRDIYGDGGQILMCALSAVEMACWDIVGKELDQPVWRLLGGRCHESLRAYANGWYRCDRTPEAFAERARAVVAKGYTAMKFDPFGTDWRVVTPSEEDLAVDLVAAVRDAVGPAVDIMVEAHSRFGVASALRIARRIEKYRPAWLEEPVPHHDILSIVEVAKASPVPIATGESFSNKHQVAELLKHGVIQIIQIEPIHIGGILASRKIADAVDARYGVIAPHAAAGPVSTMACIQIDVATPNFYIQEFFHDFNVTWEHDIVFPRLTCVNGRIPVPQGPGLGIDLNLEEIAKHPYASTDVSLWEQDWHKRRDQVAAKS
jgi:galactonate dehydratase